MMGARIVGPAAAGALVAALGPAFCYGVNFVSLSGPRRSLSLLTLVRAIPRPAAAGPGPAAATRAGSARFLSTWAKGMRLIGHPAPSRSSSWRWPPACSWWAASVPLSRSTSAGLAPRAVRLLRHRQRDGWRRPCLSVFRSRRIVGGVQQHAGAVGVAGIGVGALLLGALPWAGMSMLACLRRLRFRGRHRAGADTDSAGNAAAMMGRVQSTTTSVVFFAQLIGLVLRAGWPRCSASAPSSSCAPCWRGC